MSLRMRGSTRRGLALLGSLTLLTLAGCSEQYNGERMFWKAQQRQVPFAKDPTKATQEQIDYAIDGFNRVIRKSPGTQWAARAYLAIGGLRVLEKRYPEARESYDTVLQNYNHYKDLALAARVAIARTHEIEGDWEKAVGMYNELAEYHTWTRAGLEAPLYVAAIYEKRNEPEMVTKSFEHAIRFYTKMIAEAPTPQAANRVKSYLALSYQRLDRWQQAVEVFEQLLRETDGVNRPLVLLTLGSIYQTKLNNTPRAINLYRQLLQETPDHPYAKVARAQLEYLGQPVPPVTPTTPTAPAAGGAPATPPANAPVGAH